ncbi:MAG: hypothetical protein RLZZ546_3095, partial [Bacteroidota bacterium]
MKFLTLFLTFICLNLYAQSNKIDPALVGEIQVNNEIDCILLFDQSIIVPALAYETKLQKGKRVFEHLKNKAEISQKRLIKYLKSKNIKYKSYVIVNAISLKTSKSVLEELIAFEEVKKIIKNIDLYKEQVQIEKSIARRNIEPE